MLFILCAASGLRFGEALGIEIPHVSSDGSCIRIASARVQASPEPKVGSTSATKL
jgi:integrase